MDCRGDPHPSGLGIVLDTHNLALARNLNGGSAGQLGRQSHGEFDFRVFLDFAIDVEKDAARAHIARFSMHRSVRTGKPQPNRHFQWKSGEYALLFQGQDPVPEIFAFCNRSDRHFEKTDSRTKDRRSIGTERVDLGKASLRPHLVRYIAVSRPSATIRQMLISKHFSHEIKSFHHVAKCKLMHTEW